MCARTHIYNNVVSLQTLACEWFKKMKGEEKKKRKKILWVLLLMIGRIHGKVRAYTIGHGVYKCLYICTTRLYDYTLKSNRTMVVKGTQTISKVVWMFIYVQNMYRQNVYCEAGGEFETNEEGELDIYIEMKE